MSGLTIRELVTKLGFEIEDEKLDKFESRIDRVKKGLIGLTIAGGAAAAGLFAIAKSAANAGDDLDAQSSVLGFAVEQLQIWTRAAALGDIASEEFAGSMQFLNRNIGDAVRGQGAAVKTFKELNISLKDSRGQIRSTGDVMNDLAERFSHISDPSRRASIAMDIFGRGGVRMGRFLAEASDDVKRATEVVQAFGFYTAETAALADKTNDVLEDSQTLIVGMKNAIGIGLLPVLKSLGERFNAWTLANKKAIQTKIDRFVYLVSKAALFAMDSLEKLGRVMATTVKFLGGMENVLKIIAAALLGLGGAAVVGAVTTLISILGALGLTIGGIILEVIGLPLLIAAGIAFLALAIEDLYVWIKGGDSVLGQWFGNWQDFTKKMKTEFATLVEGLGVIWTGLGMIFSGMWNTMAGAFGIVKAIWTGDLEGFKKSFKRWATGLADMLSGPLVLAFGAVETATAGIVELLKGAYKIVVGMVAAMIPPSLLKLLGFVGDLAVKGGSAVASAFSGPMPAVAGFGGPYVQSPTQSSPYSLARPQGGQGPITVQNNTPINVTLPPGTPREHAEEMSRIFQESMDNSVRHSLQMSARPGG